MMAMLFLLWLMVTMMMLMGNILPGASANIFDLSEGNKKRSRMIRFSGGERRPAALRVETMKRMTGFILPSSSSRLLLQKFQKKNRNSILNVLNVSSKDETMSKTDSDDRSFSFSGFVATFFISILSINQNAFIANAATTTSATTSTSSSSTQQQFVPPPITTKSSSRALRLALDLEALHSKMYGAYWCSHCFDQKQTFGKEAMTHIPYIECDAEGLQSQRTLCKERQVPGYPTWEINGLLYPGQQELIELEDIVRTIQQ